MNYLNVIISPDVPSMSLQKRDIVSVHFNHFSGMGFVPHYGNTELYYLTYIDLLEI